MERIYKYYQFENSNFWELPLVKTELYFSSYDQFNDPFELHFKTTVEGPFEVRHQILIHDNPFDERIKAFKTQEEIDNFIGWINNSTSTQSGHRFKMRALGISCFSETNDEVLMWAHYSKGLSGICFEFDQSLLEDRSDNPKIQFSKINYVESIPIVNLMLERDTLIDKINCKSSRWRYEREVRAYKNNLENLKFDPEALTKIIIGANALKQDQQLWEIPHFQRLSNLVEVYRPDLKNKIFVAKPKTDSFELSIEPLDLF